MEMATVQSNARTPKNAKAQPMITEKSLDIEQPDEVTHSIETYRRDARSRTEDWIVEHLRIFGRWKARVGSLRVVLCVLVAVRRFTFLYDYISDFCVGVNLWSFDSSWSLTTFTFMTFPYCILVFVLRSEGQSRLERRGWSSGIAKCLWFMSGGLMLLLLDVYLNIVYFFKDPLDIETFHYMNLRRIAEFAEAFPQLFLQMWIFREVHSGKHLAKDEGATVNGWLLLSSLMFSLKGSLEAFLFVNTFAQRQTGGSKLEFCRRMAGLGVEMAPSNLFLQVEKQRTVHIQVDLSQVATRELRVLGRCIRQSRVLEELMFEKAGFIAVHSEGSMSNMMRDIVLAPRLKEFVIDPGDAQLPKWFKDSDWKKELKRAPKLKQVTICQHDPIINERLLTIENSTPLVQAAAAGDMTRITDIDARKAAQQNPDELQKAVIAAAACGHLEALRAVLLLPNRQQRIPKQALIDAARMDQWSVVGLLLCARADPHAETKDEVCAVSQAASQGSSKSLRQLLTSGDVDVNRQDTLRSLNAPLHWSAQNDHLVAVRQLLAARASVNTVNKTGITPVFLASRSNLTKVLKELLSAEANIDLATKDGETPLSIAARESSAEAVLVLIKARANLNAVGLGGRTPLDCAIDACNERNGMNERKVLAQLQAAGAKMSQEI